MNAKKELKTTVSYALPRDASGPCIFKASDLPTVYPVGDPYLRGPNPVAMRRSVISNRTNNAFIKDLLIYNNPLSHALYPFSKERVSKYRLQKRRTNSDD